MTETKLILLIWAFLMACIVGLFAWKHEASLDYWVADPPRNFTVEESLFTVPASFIQTHKDSNA